MTWLAEQPSVITAARVGKTLEMDPAIVLDADPDLWMIRMACAVVVQRDQERAEAEAKARR